MTLNIENLVRSGVVLAVGLPITQSQQPGNYHGTTCWAASETKADSVCRLSKVI